MRESPRQALTVERIVDAAIALADREGLAAVSMRAVAREVGSGAMSLYRHVADRDDLVARMTDRIAADFPYPAADITTWRQALERLAWQEWRSYRAHPWLVEVVGTSRPPLTPQTLAQYDWAIGWMATTGLPLAEQHRLVVTVFSWTVGIAAIATIDRREAERSGISTDAWRTRQRERIEREDPDRAPRLQILLGPGGDDHEAFFAFGLTALLTGIEASLPDAGQQASPSV